MIIKFLFQLNSELKLLKLFSRARSCKAGAQCSVKVLPKCENKEFSPAEVLKMPWRDFQIFYWKNGNFFFFHSFLAPSSRCSWQRRQSKLNCEKCEKREKENLFRSESFSTSLRVVCQISHLLLIIVSFLVKIKFLHHAIFFLEIGKCCDSVNFPFSPHSAVLQFRSFSSKTSAVMLQHPAISREQVATFHFHCFTVALLLNGLEVWSFKINWNFKFNLVEDEKNFSLLCREFFLYFSVENSRPEHEKVPTGFWILNSQQQIVAACIFAFTTHFLSLLHFSTMRRKTCCRRVCFHELFLIEFMWTFRANFLPKSVTCPTLVTM